MAGMLANNGKPLGKLRGVFFTNGDNRNDYPCDDIAAKHAANEDLMGEKISTGGVVGRLDHTNHNPDTNPQDETLVKEACVNMQHFPKKNNKGQYVGECLILDTPDGQKLYAYCKSGKKPGVSYRGGIDQDAYERGDEKQAWRQFTIEGFDIVYVPAYKECYLELVEDYLDPDSRTQSSASTKSRRANIDARSAAKAMIRVSASKQKAKEMAKVMAKERHFTEEEAIAINKEIDAANEHGSERTKWTAEVVGTPVDKQPSHTWTKEIGNTTIDMHHEDDVYGEDDIDPVTGEKIQTLSTGNVYEKDRHIANLPTVEELKQLRKIKSSIDAVEQKINNLADEVAIEMITENIKRKRGKSEESISSAIERGTVADREKDDDEELEGYLDKDGKVVKRQSAGVLGVASDEETEEDDQKNGDLDKNGKIVNRKKSAIIMHKRRLAKKSRLDEPEVEIISDDEIQEIEKEVANGESDDNIKEDERDREGDVFSELARLSKLVTSLNETVEELNNKLDSRNAEYKKLANKHRRLQQSIAGSIKSDAELENENDLQQRIKHLRSAMTRSRDKYTEDMRILQHKLSESKRTIAGLNREAEVMSQTIRAQANTLKKQEQTQKILASKNDNLGKLCIGAVAELLEIDEGKLLSNRYRIRTRSDLNQVISSLQKKQRATVTASYYPQTEGMTYALPNEILEQYSLDLTSDIEDDFAE
jgi:hypothetical protein